MGFIYTNKQIPIGAAIDKVSKFNTNEQVVVTFAIIEVKISLFVFVFCLFFFFSSSSSNLIF